jgi:hypothetical protein
MRKLVYTFFLSILALGLTQAQLVNKVVIDDFESSAADTVYQLSKEGNTVFTVADEATDKHEGSKSMRVRVNIPSGIHDWGSYGQLIYRVEDGAPLLNWSGSDSLSIWLKVIDPPATPANVVFRFHIMDRPVEGGNSEEHVYENTTILDAASDWINLRVPLFDRESDGQLNPDATGFCIMPSSWNPPAQNNKRLDLDKVVGYNISFITSTSAGDSVEVLYDDFARFGYRAMQFWVFNGKVVSSTNYGAWSSSTELVPNAGSEAGKVGLKWTPGIGWSGVYFDYASMNMAGNWVKNDTLKVKVKAPAEMDSIRLQFKSVPGGAVKYYLTKANQNWDGTWKTVEIPLQDPNWVFEGDPAQWDSTQVNKFEIISEGGNTNTNPVYFDDIWLGSPDFDVIAPNKPTNVLVTQGEYENLITWKDVDGESGETYTIYFSKEPITDVTAAGVGVVKAKIEEGSESYGHVLRAPKSDKSTTYYYAVVCVDQAGNPSEVAASGAVTNTAKGVVVISMSAPTSFAADGNLSEWQQITPFKIFNGGGNGYTPANDPLGDTTDLLVKSYIAFDNTYLYVAFDITDDIYSHDPALSTYLNDCPDLFLGFYNLTGAEHTSLKRGAEPDYHFRFYTDRTFLDGGVDSVAAGEDYIFYEKDAGDGYIIESRINLASLASRSHDSLFVPKIGYNIPIDFSINDADATNTRESILCYSPDNQDKSYQDPTRWLNTWIEDWTIGVNDEPNFAPIQYSLSQNYPNPFNPSTTIKYSIQAPGLVKIKVFNILGAEVATLVNEIQTAGNHQVSFNASRLSSGVYFYSIESGSFRNVKKMVFLK